MPRTKPTKVDEILNLIAVMGHDHRNCDDGCTTKTDFKKAKSQLLELMLECVGEDELPPIGQQGAYDPKTRTYELIIDSAPLKYHIQQVMNHNQLRAEIRTNIYKAFGVDLPLEENKNVLED